MNDAKLREIFREIFREKTGKELPIEQEECVVYANIITKNILKVEITPEQRQLICAAIEECCENIIRRREEEENSTTGNDR